MAVAQDQKLDKWVPSSTEEAELVRKQLDKVFHDSRFSLSRRYQSFLRFVLDQALNEVTILKERAVGAEVFERAPDYDTNSDPIVRVTAVEIRKRLNDYYDDPLHADELRIELPVGSYIPQFFKPETQEAEPAVEQKLLPDPIKEQRAPVAATPVPESKSPIIRTRPVIRHRNLWILGCSVVVISVLVCLAYWLSPHESALDSFWRPIFRSKQPVLIAVAFQNPDATFILEDPVRTPPPGSHIQRPAAMAIDDTVALVGVGDILKSRQQPYRVKGQDQINFSDLRQGPAVLIGAFDNRWTLQLTEPLRFHFEHDSQRAQWIEDRQTPQIRRWQRSPDALSLTRSYDDYAIVARFLDPLTNNFVVVAAGLTNNGTAAAGEFLDNPALLKQFAARAPKGWQDRNLEVVLKTTVIGGTASAPQVVATNFW